MDYNLATSDRRLIKSTSSSTPSGRRAVSSFSGKAAYRGRERENEGLIERQMFEIAIQARSAQKWSPRNGIGLSQKRNREVLWRRYFANANCWKSKKKAKSG